jgi:hypothetical protein
MSFYTKTPKFTENKHYCCLSYFDKVSFSIQGTLSIDHKSKQPWLSLTLSEKKSSVYLTFFYFTYWAFSYSYNDLKNHVGM